MRNRKDARIIILSTLSLLLFLYSCSTEECLHDTGTMTIVRIETGYFKTINVNSIFDIFLIQDSVSYVDIEGGSKVLEYVQVQNTDSVLYLNNTNSCAFLRDFKRVVLNIHFTSIHELYLTEPCKVESKNSITCNLIIGAGCTVAELNIEMDNEDFLFYTNKKTGGTYIFRGNCSRCTLRGYYAAKIDASNLKTITMYVRNASIADYYVNVEEIISYEILNSGNIIYYGSPEIIQPDSTSGSGILIEAIDN